MLRKSLLSSILVAGALTLGLASAHAATVNLSGSNAPGTSLGFGTGAGAFTVTARQWNTFTPVNDESRTLNAASGDLVTQGSNGLGETRTTNFSSTDPAVTNSDAVNSGTFGTGATAFREALLFSFTSNVRLISVTFFVPRSEGLGFVFFDGPTTSAEENTDFLNWAAAGNDALRTYTFSANTFGQNFGFGARAGGNNRFYVQSIQYEVVPLPAGGLLLASALALPFLRRKRKAA